MCTVLLDRSPIVASCLLRVCGVRSTLVPARAPYAVRRTLCLWARIRMGDRAGRPRPGQSACHLSSTDMEHATCLGGLMVVSCVYSLHSFETIKNLSCTLPVSLHKMLAVRCNSFKSSGIVGDHLVAHRVGPQPAHSTLEARTRGERAVATIAPFRTSHPLLYTARHAPRPQADRHHATLRYLPPPPTTREVARVARGALLR